MMRRREFITLLGGAATSMSGPRAARAQQAMPVVGILSSGSLSAFAHLLDAFRHGLKETGYIEGQNVAIESRGAEGHFERLPELAVELVQRRAASSSPPASVRCSRPKLQARQFRTSS
jgi:putative ABC transport system substrate-binding protein